MMSSATHSAASRLRPRLRLIPLRIILPLRPFFHGTKLARVPRSQSVYTIMPTQKSAYQNRIELLHGTLDMLVLKTLQWGDQHGYGISQAIRTTSPDVLQVETGSLYPALHRLERQKWVSSEWKAARGQRAKFYRITVLGKKQLSADYARWNKMVASIESIMTATKSATEATS